MSIQNFRGSCHCGGVRFQADIDLAAEGTSKCNCTRCWKQRWWSVSIKPTGFRLLASQDLTSKGDRGGFCRECGVTAFGVVNTDGWGDGGDVVSINVACLDDLSPADLLAAPIQYCDGLADNWWNPPAETRHL